MENEYILELKDITKKFPGVIACDDISMNAKAGEVLGLIGENGAGKSTLLKVLNGMYPAGSYSGTIILEGKEISPKSAHDAMKLGIGFVPQEINVLKNLSVMENIYMHDLTSGKSVNKWVDYSKLFARTVKLLQENSIDLDPKADVRKLSIGQQQMLMIARALSHEPKMLILDEPTTSLSSDDVGRLFSVINKLKENGTSIIFVTHKMTEILELTDRLYILRDGKNVASYERKDYDPDKIITGMIGRQLTVMYPERNVDIGEEIFKVEGLTVDHPYIQGRNLIEDVSFSVRKGEVLGLSGLVGAGRTEVVSALFGVMKKKSGKIFINGESVKISNPAKAIQNGMALVTEDRKRYGLIFVWNILQNISISNLRAISKIKLLISKRNEVQRAKTYFDMLNIKAPSINTRVDSLSGGNQQKVVLGRSLNAQPTIIMLDEPTKGIDVGSKNEIYHIINGFAEAGDGVIMISSELPELMAMCDRFIVLAEGRVSGEFTKDEATDSAIMEASVRTFK